MSSNSTKTPEQQFKDSEKLRHLGVEAVETVGGAGVGAIAGAIAGPIGMAVGAAIGAAVGALASYETERGDHLEAEHEKDLDAIGTNSERDSALPDGPPSTEPTIVLRTSVVPPAPADAVPAFAEERAREDAIAKALQKEAIDDQVVSGGHRI